MLAALIVLAHLAGIAAGGLGALGRFLVDHQERGAKALDLLLGGGAHIGREDDTAKSPRRGDRLQAGDPCPHHQHPRRLDRAGRGHHHRHGPAEFAGGIERGLVAGEVGLRRQHVHRLRPGNARDQLHRHRRDAGLCVGLDILGVLQRRQQADERGPPLHHIQLVGLTVLAAEQRALDLQHDVGIADRGGGIGGDRRPGSLIGGVEETGALTGAGLDRDVETHADELLDRIRRRRDAPLERASFLDDRDLHRATVLYRRCHCQARTMPRGRVIVKCEQAEPAMQSNGLERKSPAPTRRLRAMLPPNFAAVIRFAAAFPVRPGHCRPKRQEAAWFGDRMRERLPTAARRALPGIFRRRGRCRPVGMRGNRRIVRWCRCTR